MDYKSISTVNTATMWASDRYIIMQCSSALPEFHIITLNIRSTLLLMYTHLLHAISSWILCKATCLGNDVGIMLHTCLKHNLLIISLHGSLYNYSDAVNLRTSQQSPWDGWASGGEQSQLFWWSSPPFRHSKGQLKFCWVKIGR